jgi:oligopeptide transport system permease protein
MPFYVAKKFGWMVFSLFVIATLTFFLVNAIPGDVLSAQVLKLPPEVTRNLYAKYGFDKPLLERYLVTMTGMLRGDFGMSVLYGGESVQSILITRLPISAQLGVQQILLGVTLGLLLGVISALKNGKWQDFLVICLAIVLVSIPPLIFALMIQKLFSGGVLGLPVVGWGSFEYSILPTLAGAFGYVSFYARLMKSSMLDVIGQDYILTAESKGLGRVKIILRHVLRNSFIPILTFLPMSVVMVITGSFFIETVFSIPGLGFYYVNSVIARDISVVMGLTVFFATLYLFVVFITDILYKLFDPRIRIDGARKR